MTHLYINSENENIMTLLYRVMILINKLEDMITIQTEYCGKSEIEDKQGHNIAMLQELLSHGMHASNLAHITRESAEKVMKEMGCSYDDLHTFFDYVRKDIENLIA
jgi:hypothetical protein